MEKQEQARAENGGNPQHRKCPVQLASTEMCNTLENDVPTEEQMHRFIHVIASALVNGEFKNSDFENIQFEAESFYNYSDLSDEEELMFYRGACWGVVKLIQYMQHVKAENDDMPRLQGIIDENAELFELILQDQGMTAREISEKTGADLEQQEDLLRMLARNGLLSAVKFGRNKRYFLSYKAENMLGMCKYPIL